jgi:cytoskeleton protein RodZ
MGPQFQGLGHQCENDLGSNRTRLRLVEHCEEQVLNSLGQELRQARQGQGLELSQISSSLKISKRYLTAIEESDVGELPPGDVYLIGYTRAYAGYLGLNTGQCVEKLKTEIAAREAKCRVSIAPEPTPKHRLPSAVRHTFGFLGLL